MDWKYKADENGVTLHDHEITEWVFGEDVTLFSRTASTCSQTVRKTARNATSRRESPL
ncbi:MAG: hypothetical protein J1F09_05800 [Oscillospiraceae bacterium]|nr:hypothetical protein [Oscillospiraceae bacterium]